MTYTLEGLARRCDRCRVHEARKRLVVDAPQRPRTVLGLFCSACARAEWNEYERGRKRASCFDHDLESES